MPESVKIGQKYYQILSQHNRRVGMPRAETCRRAIVLYLGIVQEPAFWRVVQKLNGRTLASIVIELLHLWAEGKIMLNGDQE